MDKKVGGIYWLRSSTTTTKSRKVKHDWGFTQTLKVVTKKGVNSTDLMHNNHWHFHTHLLGNAWTILVTPYHWGKLWRQRLGEIARQGVISTSGNSDLVSWGERMMGWERRARTKSRADRLNCSQWLKSTPPLLSSLDKTSLSLRHTHKL